MLLPPGANAIAANDGIDPLYALPGVCVCVCARARALRARAQHTFIQRKEEKEGRKGAVSMIRERGSKEES
jgi:hypothetical protein